MRYITKEGKSLDGSCYISDARFKEMVSKGWCYLGVLDAAESPQDAYDRLSDGFEVVRIYTKGTAVRGYRDTYAMGKHVKTSGSAKARRAAVERTGSK